MVQRELIISYLQTPMNVGVEHTNIVIPGKAIHDLWEHLKGMSHQKRKRFTIAEPFLEYDFKFAMTVDKWQLARVLDEMFNTMVKWEKDCPKPVVEWSDWGNVVLEPGYAGEIEKYKYFFLPPKGIFS